MRAISVWGFLLRQLLLEGTAELCSWAPLWRPQTRSGFLFLCKLTTFALNSVEGMFFANDCPCSSCLGVASSLAIWTLSPRVTPLDQYGKIDIVGSLLGTSSLIIFNFVWKSVDPSLFGWHP